MNRIVITGATGIIGVALAELCTQMGIDVVAVVRPQSKHKSRLLGLKDKLEILECDLSHIDQLPLMTQGEFDVFYHLGWTGKGRYWRGNAIQQCKDIEITLNAAEAAKKLGCHLFIGAGSQAEYGNRISKTSPDMLVNPDTAYGVAKFAAGKLSQMLCLDLGIKHVWARIYSTYGPNDSQNSMIMYAITTLLRKEKPIFTPCEQYWDYVYCGDTAKALYLLGLYGQDGCVYNIGSGQAKPLQQYIRILRDCIDPDLPLGIGDKKYADKQVMYLCADIDTLIKDTGFTPEIPFEEGIRRTIDWCQNQKMGRSRSHDKC